MKPENTATIGPDRPVKQTFGDRGAARFGDVALAACPEFTRIIVETSQSTYDLVVLSGDSGEVLVRGGSLFPEFRCATVTGALLGGIAVKLRTIALGLNLEFLVDGTSVITSRVQAISRLHLPVVEGRA